MWSEPFIRTTKASGGEKLAVLLMDTQGMFDNETTMTLTAQIFGLSTLVSSFQVGTVSILCSMLFSLVGVRTMMLLKITFLVAVRTHRIHFSNNFLFV